MLHEALRQKLGLHVQQKGSLVTSERLRFDFSHNKPIERNDINIIENIVNSKIIEKGKIDTKIMTHDEAIKKGAIALFGEKYGSEVRVVSMGGKSESNRMAWSVELCGGIHLKDTSEAILFKIIQETGVSSGVRRIEAITRKSALHYFKNRNDILGQIINKLNSQPNMIIDKIDQIMNENSQLKSNIDKLKNEILIQNNDDTSIDLIGIKFDTKVYEDLIPKDLKSYAEKLLKSKNLDIVCVISTYNNKVSSVVTVKKTMIQKFNAVELVNIILN